MEENVDYYFNEAGLMVFTGAYHLKRGYCCKNKCMHCPWNYGKSGTVQTESKDQNNGDGITKRSKKRKI